MRRMVDNSINCEKFKICQCQYYVKSIFWFSRLKALKELWTYFLWIFNFWINFPSMGKIYVRVKKSKINLPNSVVLIYPVLLCIFKNVMLNILWWERPPLLPPLWFSDICEKSSYLVHWTRDWICQSNSKLSDLCEARFNTIESSTYNTWMQPVG